MRHSRLIISFLLSSISCRQPLQKEVYTKQPKLERSINYSLDHFQESFFNERHFSYKQNVQIDSNGKFRFTNANNIANSALMDTTRYYHSSETIIQIDTTELYLRNCKATVKGDSVKIVFSDDPFSDNYYEIEAYQVKNDFFFNYNQTFSLPDSSYKKPVFKVVNQSLILDKKKYKKGDDIKGKIVLVVFGFHDWNKKYTDTIRVFGLFKTVVE